MKRKHPARRRDTYHHGELRDALIAAGEAVLAKRGAAGFSLREAARRAGVSPSAPAHHFGDARGLLTAIATRGFERLSDRLAKAVVGVPAAKQLEAQAIAYIEFALRHESIFTLMWRREAIDIADGAYLAAGRKAFNTFERVATQSDVPVATAPRTPAPAIIAAWALFHGYARLVLDGAIDGSTPGLMQSVLTFMPSVPKEAAGRHGPPTGAHHAP